MTRKEREFQAIVLDWFTQHGRHDLPWRQTTDPYAILVSELMLQQTQVARVIPKYEAFVSRWPSVQHLASATLGDVLRAWQGLGYNRRAKYLHECAKQVVVRHGGQFPVTEADLRSLPGIGPYTAAAVGAFAHNQPVLLVETNVRQVYIHHFFSGTQELTDTAILDKVQRTMPLDNARTWYAALMDYGAHLKTVHGNNTQTVKGYTKQGTFKGSDREVRGAILRALAGAPKSEPELLSELTHLCPVKITAQLKHLQKESLLVERRQKWSLP